jgi:hypothetical protein
MNAPQEVQQTNNSEIFLNKLTSSFPKIPFAQPPPSPLKLPAVIQKVLPYTSLELSPKLEPKMELELTTSLPSQA